MSEIEDDALAALAAAVTLSDAVEAEGNSMPYIDRVDLQSRSELAPPRLNRAVDFLAARGLVAPLRVMGTAPYTFGAVHVTTEGRYALENAMGEVGPPMGGVARPSDALVSTSFRFVPRYVTEHAHAWALQNLGFLKIVFEAFDREGDWPSLPALQRGLIQRRVRINLFQPAYEIPREFGYREAPPEERVVLFPAALRYVEEAQGLLENFVRVLRLAVERYVETDDPVFISRADLSDKLSLNDRDALRLSRVLIRGTPFLSGGLVDINAWELSVHEALLVDLIDVKTIDEYLAVVGSPRVVLETQATALGLGDANATSDRPVFLIHGHDRTAKAEVARFLDRVTEPGVTILDEQPQRGRTLIEKFEDHAEGASYAVALLTADDEGRAKDEDDLRSRARQNVILELGYFVGKLGRGYVALLYDPSVERPSDIDGVAYIELDSGGAWKTKLANEMLSARVQIDPSKVISA